jgi:osmoprotectant transport system permease protein
MGDVWRFLTDPEHWAGPNGLGVRLISHLWLSTLSVLVAAVVAVPLGAAAARLGWFGTLMSSVVNVGRAIPSFALLALVLPLSIAWGFGLGFWPTVVAMVALAFPPLFINSYVGVSEVPSAVLDAAAGLGMSRRERIGSVVVPLALPSVLVGVRVAYTQVIATATLGALVAFNGLGSVIEEGRATQDTAKTVSGAALVCGAAFLAQAVLVRLERRATRWRGDRSSPLGTERA